MTFIKHISSRHDAQGEDGSTRKTGTGKKKSSKRRSLTAFILSGGGARGAYECGVYQSLVEHGVEPDILVGTSVGAINATAIAMGMTPATLTEIWLSIASPDSWLPTDILRKARVVFGNKNVFQNRRDFWNIPNWTYLFDTHPLKATLRKYFHSDALLRANKQLLITAVEIQTGQFRMFKNREITLDHVLASASIPIVFPWTKIGQEIFWDGGLLANVPPLRTAIEADPDVDEIYMVKLFPSMAPRPKTLIACVERAIEIMLQGALNNEIAHMEFFNRLIDEGRVQGDFKPIKLHTIEFHEPLEALSIINFDYGHVKNLISTGRRDTDLYFLAQEREETAGRRARGRAKSSVQANSRPTPIVENPPEAPGKSKSRKRSRPAIHATRQFQTGPQRVDSKGSGKAPARGE